MIISFVTVTKVKIIAPKFPALRAVLDKRLDMWAGRYGCKDDV